MAEKGYKKGSIQKSIGGKETLETELICVSLISSFLSIPSSHHQFLTLLRETLSILRSSQAWKRQSSKQI